MVCRRHILFSLDTLKGSSDWCGYHCNIGLSVTRSGTTGIWDIQWLVRVPLAYRTSSDWCGYHWHIGHSVTGAGTIGLSDLQWLVPLPLEYQTFSDWCGYNWHIGHSVYRSVHIWNYWQSVKFQILDSFWNVSLSGNAESLHQQLWILLVP